MTMAITKAVEERRQGGHLRLHRQHLRQRRRLRGAGRASPARCSCPQGKIALGKLAQALVHGAQLLQVDGNFDDCLELASKLADDYPVALVNSVNPFRIEGQKTAAFEIVDALGDAPDVHCLPVGNAGNITAYWQGYREYADATALGAPRRRGCGASRPAGSAPIVTGEPVLHPRRSPPRSGSATRRPGRRPSDARDESGGRIDAGHRRADPRRLPAAGPQRGGVRRAGVGRVGRRPAAGRGAGGSSPASAVVCTVTGNGLKDPDWAISGAPAPVTIPVDAAAAATALGLA